MYNDDLDEDNSDYVEEGDGEGEEDDDIDSEEDEANDSATGQPQAPAGLWKNFTFLCSYVGTGVDLRKIGCWLRRKKIFKYFAYKNQISIWKSFLSRVSKNKVVH